VALDFLSSVGGLLDAFGVGKPKQKYGPTPSEAQANSLFQALLDPNNSLVKQNTDINLQKGMQDFLMQLKQMQMLDARRGVRGNRATFFQPERADEVINYLTTRGMPAIAENARNTAKTDIRNTAASLQGFAPMEQARSDAMYANKNRDYSQFQTAGGFGGLGGRLGGGLQELLQALQGGSPRITSQGPLPWLQGGGF